MRYSGAHLPPHEVGPDDPVVAQAERYSVQIPAGRMLVIKDTVLQTVQRPGLCLVSCGTVQYEELLNSFHRTQASLCCDLATMRIIKAICQFD